MHTVPCQCRVRTPGAYARGKSKSASPKFLKFEWREVRQNLNAFCVCVCACVLMTDVVLIHAFKGTFLALELTLPAVCGCKKPFLRERFEQAYCSGSCMTRRIRHFHRQSARKKFKSCTLGCFPLTARCTWLRGSKACAELT